MDRATIAEQINRIKEELLRRFGRINMELLGVGNDVEKLLTLPAWTKSRLKDENGSVEIDQKGYGKRVLVIKLEDPYTDKIPNRTAFVIYFSLQSSKPIVPSQLRWKLNTLYKVVKELRAKGYHVFPAIVAYAFTPGAVEVLRKHKVEFFSDVVGVQSWIVNKLINRMNKLVEVAKFTLKFDKIFIFLKKVVEGLGFQVPTKLLEDWVIKPKYPVYR